MEDIQIGWGVAFVKQRTLAVALKPQELNAGKEWKAEV